jgi:phospholipid transport system transporter-binding protein
MASLFRLDGAVTMWSASRQLAEGRARLRTEDVVVDFSDVGEADSAALALLLDWRRTAHATGHRLSVRALPAGLRSLADLYGVADLLPPEA